MLRLLSLHLRCLRLSDTNRASSCWRRLHATLTSVNSSDDFAAVVSICFHLCQIWTMCFFAVGIFRCSVWRNTTEIKLTKAIRNITGKTKKRAEHQAMLLNVFIQRHVRLSRESILPAQQQELQMLNLYRPDVTLAIGASMMEYLGSASYTEGEQSGCCGVATTAVCSCDNESIAHCAHSLPRSLRHSAAARTQRRRPPQHWYHINSVTRTWTRCFSVPSSFFPIFFHFIVGPSTSSLSSVVPACVIGYWPNYWLMYCPLMWVPHSIRRTIGSVCPALASGSGRMLKCKFITSAVQTTTKLRGISD